MEGAARKTTQTPRTLTPRKLAACLRNLEKARAAPKTPERYARSRRNNLQHGFYSRDLRETVPRLGERLEEFDRYLGLFERTFAPQDETERAILRQLGETAWRRLRAYRAQALFEMRKVRRLLGPARKPTALTPEETRNRAFALLVIFCQHGRFFKRVDRLAQHIERLLRALLRKRTGGKPDFRFLTRERRDEMRRLLDEWIPAHDGSRRLLKNQRS